MKPELPRISVVTPSFNQAPFLEATILSVVGQCYPNLEYIVMDGGSTDGSVEILKRYADRLAYCQSGRDNGQAAAINAGFARATGDLLCWINSDDFFFPGALHRMAARFGAHTNEPALIYGNCLFFREGSAASAKILTAKPFDAARLRTSAYVIQPSTCWTRELWEKTGPLDEALTYAFDWDWLIRASAHAPFIPFADMISAYRRHDAHKSGSGGDRRRQEILTVARRHAPARVRASYEFAIRNWRQLHGWSALRKGLQHWHCPAAGAIARVATPALWKLPAGVRMSDLRAARSMLDNA